MDQLKLGVFSPSVLLDVARQTGRLAAAGLDVRDVAVPSSPAQFRSLHDGEYDAVFTSPDNVLAYRFLPANPLGQLFDVEIVAGVDRGLGLCLGARPGVTAPAELSGGRFGVDVPTSGFAFVGYALLEELGLSHSALEIVALGSTPKRVAALHTGGCDATVLNAGNELVAQMRGCALLADVTRLGPYLGTVIARLREAPGAAVVDRLVNALADTARSIVAGDLDAEATGSAARLLSLDDAGAAKHVAVLRDPARGLIGDGSVDAAALRTLVDLRGRFLPAPELSGIPARFDEVVRPAVLTG
ncbi:ABC transporter substrate-binding protein [Mycolicibacterium stellerae]|uniref:ABC transporter substrate-binding protein n=1 Tax=Mycolicibacterium stellerae TaxID=2358193 RepID=UPI000F0BA1C7|nr:ABC transporter substrate-binding protein [Mycolicibacterium stellerae]